MQNLLEFLSNIHENCHECHCLHKKFASILAWGLRRCDRDENEKRTFFVSQFRIYEHEFPTIYRQHSLL